ncbi:hypothetical protein [Microcoleus sp.]|uniref:hypothetical protein n=1 Tax=Microcoleus sp. TaxID=44472 RepID=UPI003C70BE3E
MLKGDRFLFLSVQAIVLPQITTLVNCSPSFHRLLTDFAIFSLLAFTGSVIIGAQFLLGGAGQAAAKPVPSQTQTPIALSQLIQKADAALPGGKISYIQFPEDKANKLVIQKSFPEQKTGHFDFSSVEIDRFTGQVLKAEKVLEPNPVFKVLLTIVIPIS